MNPLAWLALGIGLLLLPVSSRARVRAAALAERGRLSGGSVPVAVPRLPPPAAAAVAVTALAAVGTAAASGPVIGAAAGLAAGTAAHAGLAALRARAVRRRESGLLTAVRLVAAELDAGARPAAALDAAAAAAAEYRQAFAEAAEACRRGEEPVLDGELSGLGHAWRLAAETGAPLAAVVERVGDDLVARAEQRRAVAGAVAGARSSAFLLGVLPVLGLLLGSAMQADPLHVLLGTPAGRLLCLVGVALDCAGLLWTMRLTGRAGPRWR